MRHAGALAVALLWVVASQVGFGLVAWRVDGEAVTRRFPRPLSARDRGEIEDVLAEYRSIYQDLYATGGQPDMLNLFPATAPVKHRIFRDIGFLRDAGLVHVQDLAGARVVEATAIGPGVAAAVVEEEWNAQIQRADDRVPVAPLRGLSQAFRYTLVRVDGKWVIAAWDLVDSTAAAEASGAGK